MNIAIVISIVAVFIAAVPIYFLAKSNARENEARAQKRVSDAVEPVQRALDASEAKCIRLQARVTEVEDKLYGRTTT